MYLIDHSHDEPRWAGWVRLGAAGVFAALVSAVAIVDVSLMSVNETAIEAATTSSATSCADDSTTRACRAGTRR